jgi:hypothetical protein
MPSLPIPKPPSLTPHLRNSAAVPDGSPQSRKLDATVASCRPPSVHAQYEAACEATRRVSDPIASETVKGEAKVEDSLARKMATVDLGVEGAKQDSHHKHTLFLFHANRHSSSDSKRIC